MIAARSLCAVSLAVAALVGPAAASAQANVADHRVRVIVAFHANAAPAVRAQVARWQGRVIADLAEVNAIGVSIPASRLAALRALAGVEFVEGESTYRIMGSRAGAAPALVAETVPYGIPMVQADLLPPPGPGSERKKLCIIDSGIDGTHQEPEV